MMLKLLLATLLVFKLGLGAATLAQAPDAPIFRDVSAEAGIRATHRAVWDPDEALEGYLAIGQAWGDMTVTAGLISL